MVQSAQNYASWELHVSDCPFCETGMNYGNNGLEERSCPKCRPLYKQEMAAGKLPPHVRETGTPFGFVRWAIIKRAEADSAEAGWSFEKRKQLIDDLVSIWVGTRVSCQISYQTQQAQADARRSLISSRSTY